MNDSMTEEMPEPAKDTIRILHTADWHLGREFHGADLTDAHQAFFDWLGSQILERDVDLVIMAGDIFDRALPPLSAVALFNRNLDRISELAPIVLVAGNHDSIVRMGHGALLKEGIHLRSGTDQIGEAITFDGGAFPLAIYPIPYLDPIASSDKLECDEATHGAVLAAAVSASLADLAGQPDGTRSLAIAHAFVTGGKVTDSERGISVGGAFDVPSSTFDGFDYVALGHLHRPQQMDSHVRYSGSPLFLSFSEVGAEKSVEIVDLFANGSIEVETVAVPPSVEVGRIRGELEDLLTSDEFTEYEDHWLEVEVTDTKRPYAPMEKLGRRFRHVLSLRFPKLAEESAEREAERLLQVSQKDPLELVTEFVNYVREGEVTAEERDLLERALASRTASETGG